MLYLSTCLHVYYKTMTDPTPEPQLIKSACGGILKDPSAYPSAMFNGERVYFCANACLKAFLSAPEAFMAGEVEHPLDEDETPES